MPAGDDELVLIGVIAGAHGIRGEVKLKSFTADPADITAYGVLRDEAGKHTIKIVSLKPAKDAFIAKLKDVNDRNAAEALRGTKLYVPRARMPEPGEDSWYHADLIGLQIVGPDGTAIGTVVAVENFGAGDLLEIAPLGGGRSDFLPFTKAFVPDVDIKGGRVIVAPPDDFLAPVEPEGSSDG